MERVEVTNGFLGICHMQVCAVADATDDEILEVCDSRNPSGTSNGWCHVIRESEHPNMQPVACKEHPERKHFLVAC
jgi:hypothetical protein